MWWLYSVFKKLQQCGDCTVCLKSYSITYITKHFLVETSDFRVLVQKCLRSVVQLVWCVTVLCRELHSMRALRKWEIISISKPSGKYILVRSGAKWKNDLNGIMRKVLWVERERACVLRLQWSSYAFLSRSRRQVYKIRISGQENSP
jgi:hypothetical protein